MSDINDALIEAVKACGGSKQVGPRLWPEKTPDAAQRLLLDCLNPERPAHLTPEQMVLLLRLARDRGCHAGMQMLARELSYAAPVPVEPEDEADELQRQVLEMGRAMQAALARLERLQARPGLRSAA